MVKPNAKVDARINAEIFAKRILESGQAITLERVDDFPKLWAAVQRDDALEKEGKERLYWLPDCQAEQDNYNPVKHGLVKAPMDWEYSGFHRYVREGDYDELWGALVGISSASSVGSE